MQCLKAGKNVFIEKPMAMTVEGANDIEAARVASGKVVFVGYMRRYATAFLRVKEELSKVASGHINYIRVRDIIGMVSATCSCRIGVNESLTVRRLTLQNDLFVEQSGTFPLKFTDFPAGSGAERGKLSELQLAQSLGDKAGNELDQRTWMLLNGLASHDLSALRELVGMPQRILSAIRSPDGLFVWVTMQ